MIICQIETCPAGLNSGMIQIYPVFGILFDV